MRSSPANAPPQPTGAIYFVVGNRPHGPWSYTWRIWWGQTSFYIKPAHINLAEFKVSLHGEDPRHDAPMFKVGIDRSAETKVEKAGGAFRKDDGLPIVFPGIAVDDGAKHVLRLRTTWDLFQRADQSAPVPKDTRPTNYYGHVPAPAPGCAVDVDIYVNHGRPYWPREKELAAKNAGLGPLRNGANDFLTAAVVERPSALHPPPARSLLKDRSKAPLLRRGIGSAADENTGLLWIVEQMLDVSTQVERDDGELQ